VWSVEIVEEFAQSARLRLAEQEHDVEIRVGDGSRGWSDHAPYDRILVTAAAKEPPPALLDQLAPGGRIILPLGADDVQRLSVVTRAADGEVLVRPLLPVRFTKLETMG
jgi:protein-L-isoaspartate(D-aspartate) O-methyltransferase